MQVEYLIIIDSGSEYCREKSSLNSLLQSNPDINITGSSLKHKALEVHYDVQEGFTETDKHRHFHITINLLEEARLDEFHDLLKSVRKLLNLASGKEPQVLWDDVSLFYSEKAYPEIYKIENLMRKLITKFMLTNIGFGWVKDTVPEDLKRPRLKEAKSGANFLYDKDFIDLSVFLFDEYRTQDIKELNDKIRSLDAGKNQYTLDDIRDFLPRSNWERYFKEQVGFEGTYLKSRWEKLYKLRCKIAHNNFFTKSDYESVISLVGEVKPKVEAVILQLSEIKVSEEERDDFAELLAIQKNSTHGLFINSWNNIQSLMSQIVDYIDLDISSSLADLPVKATIDFLRGKNILDIGDYNDLLDSAHLRDSIVNSNYDEILEDNDVLRQCELLQSIEYYFVDFLADYDHDKAFF